MRVAYFDSSNKVINVIMFAENATDFENFYDHLPNIVSHQVLGEGVVAGLDETGTRTVLKPYPSWIWNEEQVIYLPPTPHPVYIDRETYYWDEPSLTWKEVTDEMKAQSE